MLFFWSKRKEKILREVEQGMLLRQGWVDKKLAWVGTKDQLIAFPSCLGSV